MQLFGSAYGDDPVRPPDLSFLHMHLDRGYSFERQHQETLAPAKDTKWFSVVAWACIGLVHVQCDEHGNPVKNKTCAQCNKDGATWFCGTCGLFFRTLLEHLALVSWEKQYLSWPPRQAN